MSLAAVFIFLLVGAVFAVMSVLTAVRGNGWFLGFKPWVRVALIGVPVALFLVALGLQLRVDDRNEEVWAPNARHWSRVPLLVARTAGMQAFAPQLEHAMQMWNMEVGCALFVPAVDNIRPDVRIVFLGEVCFADATFVDQGAAARTFYCADGTADVEVRRLDDVRVAYRLFGHELGHVLGLVHDRFGLMMPNITSASLEEQAIPSRKDREALADRYCRRRQQ